MNGAPRNHLSLWLGLAFVVIVLDQVSKAAVNGLLAYGERVKVLPVFDITLIYNRGAAFSFLATEAGWQRWLFTALGVAVAVFITWLLATKGHHKLFAFALALIMGGALGNVIDRVAYGHVIDFVLVYYNDHLFPAFNLADSAITVGAAMLILDELLRARRAT